MVDFKEFISKYKSIIHFDSLVQYIELCDNFEIQEKYRLLKSDNIDMKQSYCNRGIFCVNFNEGMNHSYGDKKYYLDAGYNIKHYSEFVNFNYSYEIW